MKVPITVISKFCTVVVSSRNCCHHKYGENFEVRLAAQREQRHLEAADNPECDRQDENAKLHRYGRLPRPANRQRIEFVAKSHAQEVFENFLVTRAKNDSRPPKG